MITPARLSGRVTGGIVPSLSEPAPGVTRLTTVALPGLTRPGVRATTAPLLRAQISWALRRLRVRPSAVVSGYLEDVLGRWGPAVNVLYCTDDYVAGAGLMGLSAAGSAARNGWRWPGPMWWPWCRRPSPITGRPWARTRC